MSITLRRLCRNAESSCNMKLAAGRNGLDNDVRWVHIAEESGVPNFLRGGELIFTTGIGLSDDERLLAFVRELREHGAAGLAVNLGVHIGRIPPKVLVYCEEMDFPLFTLPKDTNTVDIIYEFCRRIIDSEEQETSLMNALRGLIFGGEKRGEYVELLKQRGFDENSDYTLIIVSSESGMKSPPTVKKDSALWKIIRRSKFHSAAFSHNDCVIVVRQNTSDEEMERLIAELNTVSGLDFRMGISEKQEGFNALSNCYRQCVSALAVSKITGKRVSFYDDIGIYKLIFGVEDKGILKNYVDKALGTLIRFDGSNNSDYVFTLKVYLENNGSVLQTSEHLGVHRNTVNYKIKAIREILGIALDEEDRMNLLLAFHVREVLDLK